MASFVLNNQTQTTVQSSLYVLKVFWYTFRGDNNAIFIFISSVGSAINPISFRKAKTLWSFGLSEWNRVKGKNYLLSWELGE